MSDAGNDGDVSRTRRPLDTPDPQGEAALILVESLLHGILARDGLSLDEALEIAQRAIEVQLDICEERGEEIATAPSLRFLKAIKSSLRIDEGQDQSPDIGQDGTRDDGDAGPG